MKAEKILVIEDESDVLINIKTILSEEGYEVITAKNGQTGIELARTEKPEMIICDIAMPGFDGYGVLEELSIDKKTRSIPFIFLTAKVEKEDIRKGMQLGADDYIFKPFRIDDLLKAIKTRLKRIEVLKSEATTYSEDITKNKYEYDDKLFIQVKDKPQITAIKDIVYITAENQYTLINTIDKNSILIRKSITDWEKLLPEKRFLRIHRSTIINTEYIVKIEKLFNTSYHIYLKDIAEPILVSKRYSALLRKNKI